MSDRTHKVTITVYDFEGQKVREDTLFSGSDKMALQRSRIAYQHHLNLYPRNYIVTQGKVKEIGDY